MSAFRNAAVAALRNNRNLRSYESAAEPVLRAIATQEERVVRNLTQFATQQGLTAQAARAALRNAGLNAPEPTPPAPVRPTAEQAIEVSANTIAELLAFARQHGFRPTGR